MRFRSKAGFAVGSRVRLGSRRRLTVVKSNKGIAIILEFYNTVKSNKRKSTLCKCEHEVDHRFTLNTIGIQLERSLKSFAPVSLVSSSQPHPSLPSPQLVWVMC